MGRKTREEKRRYERYNTELKVYFDFAYDIKTKVKFKILDKKKEMISSRKYSGLSRNVSAEGLCFACRRKLRKGDFLDLEVYLPGAAAPVRMRGEVRWSQCISDEATREKVYQTGVLLKTVEDKPVEGTIHYDKEYRVHWSIVLESVLGSFKDLARQQSSERQLPPHLHSSRPT